MKIVTEKESKTILVSDSCVAKEYPNGDPDIWGSVIEVRGRYPARGVTVNEECKELVYILDGEGILVVNETAYQFHKGDQIVIDKGEKFYWEGNLVMFMPCTPAWYPAQHKTLEE